MTIEQYFLRAKQADYAFSRGLGWLESRGHWFAENYASTELAYWQINIQCR